LRIRFDPKKLFAGAILLTLFFAVSSHLSASTGAVAHGKVVYNVKDFGATGNKADNALPAIQKAIDAAAVKGGTVYLPPGDYSSGTIRLRSHVNLYLEAGATLYASENPNDFAVQKVKSKDALLFGEDLEDISIGGRGTIDGQQKYFWADDTLESARWTHKMMQIKMGGSTRRSYPAGHPKQEDYPHLLWLGRCNNVSITGLSWLHSPSWSFALFACSRVVIDGIYIYTSLKDAVWADGIDIVSSHDISISNSTIATGDDCIAIVCGIPEWGPDYPTENITITNCRFSSASAAIKFTEGNSRLVQHVVVSNCAIFDCNRGITLQIATGGTVRDVVFSNITMDLHRFDWFWAGDGNAFNIEIHRTSEWNEEPPKPGEPGPGLIKDVIFHDIIVHCQGTSAIEGHPERWLEGITFANIKFFISTDPKAPYDTATSAMIFRRAKNLKLQNIEVYWDKPTYDKWQSALLVEDVDGLQLSGFSGNAAWPEKNIAAVELNHVKSANVDNSVAPEGTNVFLKIAGADSHDIHLFGNDFHFAKVPYVVDPDVKPDSVTALDNFLPGK
jgi:hypothetical protein